MLVFLCSTHHPLQAGEHAAQEVALDRALQVLDPMLTPGSFQSVGGFC